MTKIDTQASQQFRQIILLDSNVQLVGSSDSIFSTKNLKLTPVEKWFPFIESIFASLKSLTINDGELVFSRIESPADFLPGSYDFSFVRKKIEDRELIQWSIYDYTKVYGYLTKYQQLKNEMDIYRQKIEYQNKKIKNIEDLFL